MVPHALIDLHCDTLTACGASDARPNTLDDPKADLSLSNLPRHVHWGQCYAIFIPDALTGNGAEDYYYAHQASFARQVKQFSARVAPCRTAGDMETAWTQGKAAAILTVENGSALGGKLERVDTLSQDGVKMMTLTWNGSNEIGSGHASDQGLTSFGRAVIPRMEERGILVDVSHLNDTGFRDVLDVARKPFVASHSNARAVCSHKRNLTDDQIREMARRRCLIGLNYSDHFLREGGKASFDDLLRHVEHFLTLGAEDCLALGSDFDGTTLPPWLDSPKKAAGLYDRFLQCGFSPALCDKLFFRNALAFFRVNLDGSGHRPEPENAPPKGI